MLTAAGALPHHHRLRCRLLFVEHKYSTRQAFIAANHLVTCVLDLLCCCQPTLKSSCVAIGLCLLLSDCCLSAGVAACTAAGGSVGAVGPWGHLPGRLRHQQQGAARVAVRAAHGHPGDTHKQRSMAPKDCTWWFLQQLVWVQMLPGWTIIWCMSTRYAAPPVTAAASSAVVLKPCLLSTKARLFVS